MTLFHFWHSQSKKHVPRDPFSFLCLSVCPRLLLSDCVCAPASVSHIISVLKQASFHLFTSLVHLRFLIVKPVRVDLSQFHSFLSLSLCLSHSLTLSLFVFSILHTGLCFFLSLFFSVISFQLFRTLSFSFAYSLRIGLRLYLTQLSLYLK